MARKKEGSGDNNHPVSEQVTTGDRSVEQGAGHTLGPLECSPVQVLDDGTAECVISAPHPSRPGCGYAVATVQGFSGAETEIYANLFAAALTAPHDCGDPTCPGVINKRKLEAFDDMLAALRACERELGIKDDFVPLGPAIVLAPIIRAALSKATGAQS